MAAPDVTFIKPDNASAEELMLWKEQVANVSKHWVRAVTACSSKCIFCLDMDTPRNVYLTEEDVKADILLGRTERDAWKIILSGGEASLHPLFPEFIRYAREVGYGRVQTVTNGWRYADRGFYETCVQAGLGEITFSLHGHTPELHNRLTQHPGSFHRIVAAIRRAARDPRVICSIDVVINKQNVAVLDKIVQLGIKLGVTEFDLLHVIPQAAGFTHRDELFYDPREHLDVLHRVFRLNRHPRFVVWTNRFPVSFLEGMEDLIQDPHKMIDELDAFRYDARRYLDTGQAADCRQPERCVHCFNEGLCTTMDRTIERQHEGTWRVWDVGADRKALRDLPAPLPFGIDRVGVTVPASELEPVVAALPQGAGLYWRPTDDVRAVLTVPTTLVLTTAAQCEAWLHDLPEAVDEVELHLGQATAPWILAHQPLLTALGDRVRIHQPTFEHFEQATTHDVRDPAGFFRALQARLRVSGLPACVTPGMTLCEAMPVLPASAFDAGTGRLTLPGVARHHIVDGYRSKSSRCADCALTSRCEGMHVNMVRDQGLRQLQPLTAGAWHDDALAQLTARWPAPPARMATGMPLQPAAPSLPGYAMPTEVTPDPLEVVAAQREARRAERREEIRALMDGKR